MSSKKKIVAPYSRINLGDEPLYIPIGQDTINDMPKWLVRALKEGGNLVSDDNSTSKYKPIKFNDVDHCVFELNMCDHINEHELEFDVAAYTAGFTHKDPIFTFRDVYRTGYDDTTVAKSDGNITFTEYAAQVLTIVPELKKSSNYPDNINDYAHIIQYVRETLKLLRCHISSDNTTHDIRLYNVIWPLTDMAVAFPCISIDIRILLSYYNSEARKSDKTFDSSKLSDQIIQFMGGEHRRKYHNYLTYVRNTLGGEAIKIEYRHARGIEILREWRSPDGTSSQSKQYFYNKWCACHTEYKLSHPPPDKDAIELLSKMMHDSVICNANISEWYLNNVNELIYDCHNQLYTYNHTAKLYNIVSPGNYINYLSHALSDLRERISNTKFTMHLENNWKLLKENGFL